MPDLDKLLQEVHAMIPDEAWEHLAAEQRADLVVQLDGYSGKGRELVGFEVTATGLRVTLRHPLAVALRKWARET